MREVEARSTVHNLLFVLRAGDLAHGQPRRDQPVPLNDLGVLAPLKGPSVHFTDFGGDHQFCRFPAPLLFSP